MNSLFSRIAGSVGAFLFRALGGVPRRVEEKLGDIYSLKDFGAKGDLVTDNASPIEKALNNAGGHIILVPVDSYGGDYIAGTTITATAGSRLYFEGAARIGGNIVMNGRVFSLFGGGSGEYRSDTVTKGFALEIYEPLTGVGASATYMLNRIFIKEDRLDAVNDGVAGTKVDGMLVEHRFGGSGTRGGRHALEAILRQTAVTEVDNTDRNYSGFASSIITTTGDGGSSGTGLGAYFGGNSVAMNQGGTYIFNLTSHEFNTHTDDFGGNEVSYHSGIQIASKHKKRGYTYDVGIAVSLLLESTTTFADGIRFGPMNGLHPLGADSTVIRVSAVSTIQNGLVLPRCTTDIIASGAVNLSNTGLAIATASASIQLSNLRITVVTGSPEGAVTAPVGSIALRTDGGAGTSFYVKESGTGNTGWVGK